MNQVEEAVFYHAMVDIHSHLRIRRGSRPHHTWLDVLADVDFDLDYWLRRLDNPGLMSSSLKPGGSKVIRRRT